MKSFSNTASDCLSDECVIALLVFMPASLQYNPTTLRHSSRLHCDIGDLKLSIFNNIYMCVRNIKQVIAIIFIIIHK